MKINFKNILSRFQATHTEHEKTVRQLVNAIKNQRSLYKKEIREWKKSRMSALSTQNPRRNSLIDLFEDILGDAFIYGISDTRKLRISNKGFVIVNKNGEIDYEKTKLLKKQWFNQFIKYAVESVYFGYSLIYPKELDKNGYIKKIALIPRQNIIPEKEIILKDMADQQGIKFRDTELNKWLIWINYEDFLGLLDKAAPLWIFKKHSWQNWDEFEEMFGIPIRTAKTSIQDKRVQAEIDKWLKDLGSSQWGRFPEGVEIDIKESSSRDSFNVFNEKRKAANEELSILLEGNAETAKDTGSRAKADSIIDSTQRLIELDDELRVQYIVNDDLLPLLQGLGYPFEEGDEFQWNYNEQTSPKERLDIFKGVKELGYKVKKEQIETELDVEIIGEYDTNNSPEPTNEPPKSSYMGFNMPHAHVNVHGAENHRVIQDIKAELTPQEEDFLRQFYEDPQSVNWNNKDFIHTHEKLLEALKEGWGNIDFDFESTDHLTMELFQANIHRFGMDKTLSEILQLNEILKTSKDFSEFRERVKRMFANYKEIWLRAEWDHAWAVAQMGAKYVEMMRDIDIAPYWRFVAMLDEGTTLVCSSLDNIVFDKRDKKASVFLPPLHFNCRSDAEDVPATYTGKISSFSDAVTADPEGYERMKRQGFDVNWGEAQEVFNATQNYLTKAGISSINPEMFDFSAFDLKPFGFISPKSSWPEKSLNIYQLTDRGGNIRITDAQDMPAWVQKSYFDRLDSRMQKAAVDILENADEIYWFEAGGIHYKRYIKYYKGSTLEALVHFDRQNKATLQSLQIITNPDSYRKGLLIYTPEQKLSQRIKKYEEYGKDYVKKGINKQTGAYIVYHKSHNISELNQNLFTSKRLKEAGFTVELLPVSDLKSPDAKINGIPWEFKLLTHFKNLFNTIKRELKQGSKQNKNVLLHINGNYNKQDIIRALQAEIKNDTGRRIHFVGVLFNNNKFYVFSRKQIESREFERILKK